MQRASWILVVASCLATSVAATACHLPHRTRSTQVVKAPTFAPVAARSAVSPVRRAVLVAEATDRSKRLGIEDRARVTGVVQQWIERTGYAVADATPDFVVSTTVTSVAVGVRPGMAIDCEVSVRVATATAGGRERWDAKRTAIATGTASATPGGGRPAHLARAVNDCVLAATEQVVTRRILPFLERAG